MNVELYTMVMVQNPTTGEVLVQNRTGKWPGWSFPGGRVDPFESFAHCAIREIKEETGLTISNLQHHGIAHWCNLETDDRYIVYLYKTQHYSGRLIPEFDKGQNFWYDASELANVPREKFSNERFSYIQVYFGKEFNEIFMPHKGEEIEIIYL